MPEHSGRLADVIAAIDAANARDPHTVEVDGRREPAELVYGRRMSETLARIAPAASEPLTIAVRGQHIERWTSPRKALQEFHARRLGEIMTAAGYGADAIGRVGALIRKERLKLDTEVQMLEDV